MKPSTRDRIRASALALFAEKGFAATPTQEICKRAKITKPVLYYHFKSKAHLYRHIVLEAHSELLRELTGAASRGGNVREKLVNVLTSDFSLTMRNPQHSSVLFRMVFSPQRGDPAIDFVSLGMDWLNVIQGIAQEGVRRKDLSCRPAELAMALLGVDLIYSMSYLVRGWPKLDRRLARRVVQLLVDGCRPEVTDR